MPFPEQGDRDAAEQRDGRGQRQGQQDGQQEPAQKERGGTWARVWTDADMSKHWGQTGVDRKRNRKETVLQSQRQGELSGQTDRDSHTH